MRRSLLLTAGAPWLLAAAPERDCRDCPEMIQVEAGTFTLGTDARELAALGLDPYFARRETPQQQVRIETAFLLGRTEITRRQFRRFAAQSGYRVSPGCFVYEGSRWRFDEAATWQKPGFAQSDDHPAVCLSRVDATAYAAWLSERTGRRYTLPSETQWEYAARAGTASLYPWGGGWGDGCRFANAGDAATQRMFAWAGKTLGVKEIQAWTPAPCDDRHATSAPVGRLAPNAWGFHDLIGNVQEWTADCLTPDYARPRSEAAVADGDCTKGVLRGQGWTGGPAVLRPAFRLNGDAAERRFTWGFRVAAALEKAPPARTRRR